MNPRRAFVRGVRWRRWAVVIAIVTAVAACVPSPSQYTVEYYRAHPDAREKKLAECANNPGALRDTPDCINARQAGLTEGVGRLRDLPPLGLIEAEEQASKRRQSDEISGSAEL